MNLHQLRAALPLLSDADLTVKVRGAVLNVLSARIGSRGGLQRIADELYWYCCESGRRGCWDAGLAAAKAERKAAAAANAAEMARRPG